MKRLFDESEDRAAVLHEVREYASRSLAPTPFVRGETKVPVSGKVLDPDDIAALVEASLDGWLTAGRFHAEFERQLAKYVGARNAVFVNSGSSANLVALSALTSHKLGSRRIKPGEEVSLSPKAQEMALVMEAQSLAERDIPEYVAPDGASKITFTRVPTLDEVPYPVKMEPNLVVEFYSR